MAALHRLHTSGMRRFRRALPWFGCAALSLSALGACTAEINGKGLPGASSTGANASGGNGTTSDPGPTVTAQCVQGASFAPARLLLISDDQYRNVVHDVFGVTFPSTVDITAPPSTSGSYPYNENAQVQTTTVQAYQRAADQVAALMPALSPCASGSADATCIEQFLRATLPL